MPTRPPSPPAPARPPASYAYIFPLAATLLLLASCILISSRTVFWFDELCTYYPATDPSFLHMLRAQTDLINSAPPVYTILMWAWAHVFGGSELSLRLASSLGFCAALLILFQLLRRAFGTFPAGFATLAWCTASTLVMKENAEARSYGLFVLELALAIAAYHALLTAPILTKKTAAANIAIHALLILTHYLAIFYGVAFCAAALAHELLTGRRRLRRILCIPAGYLAILPWLPIYFHHTEFTHPHGWIREPYLPDLLAGLNLGVPGLGLIALTLAAGYAITTLLTPRSAAPPAPSPAPFVVQPSGCPQPAAHPLLPLALALALVPLLM